MYHYVRKPDPALPHFRFLHIDNFRNQLDHFADTYGFVTQAEWADFITHGTMPDTTGKVVLTFDDAMSCHHDEVFKELVQRDLWGIFYVPTGPYETGEMLDVHRIHLLCGAFDGQTLLSRLLAKVTDAMLPDARRAEFREQTYTTQTNQAGVAEFKRILNYYIDIDLRAALLGDLARDLGFVFDTSAFYVPPERLRDMAQAGMIIGSHTRTHPVMSKLDAAQQAFEIEQSFAQLDAMGALTPPRTYCHPYGGFHSFDEHTKAALRSADTAYAFNVESRQIEATDWAASSLHLPRFDCNEFPFGKAS